MRNIHKVMIAHAFLLVAFAAIVVMTLLAEKQQEPCGYWETGEAMTAEDCAYFDFDKPDQGNKAWGK